MKFWKIYCEEDKYPGLWQRWFQEQCVAVGWAPGSGWGYHLVGETNKTHGWTDARSKLQLIEPGDRIVVHLRNWRLGRVGEVVRKRIQDSEWDPLVPKSTGLPYGELGRRVLVRWDLTIGPSDRDQVVLLPSEIKLAPDVIRRTLREVDKGTFHALERVMRQPERWVGLLSHFAREKSLSDYIAAYPHRLEDGLRAYPSKEVREKVFDDRSRSDVLLLDRNNVAVIVECKQDPPTPIHIQQLARYLHNFRKEAPQQPEPRGILIHTGARRLSEDVRKEIRNSKFKIEALQYQLNVGFDPCE